MAPSASARILTRRAALGALTAGVAAFTILGPRGAQEAPRGRIVLDYWEKWTRHEGDAMERIVDDFNRSQDRIFVRYIVVSDIGQKALVSIAGGRPPDLIGLYSMNVPAYAESRAVLPLDELAASVGMSLDQYTPGVRRVMVHKGRWWATVNTAGSIALYYNKSAFREANLDPEKPPHTIAELDNAHHRLVRRDASGQLSRIGFLHREPGWWSWLWAYHFGGKIYNDDTARALVDSPENIRATEWLQTYAKEFHSSDDQSFIDGFGNYFTPENAFLTGKLAMIVQGPWIANLVNAFKPDLDYGVAPFPTLTAYDPAAPVGLIDTDVLVIPRGSAHPREAMEFIAFTQRQDMTERLATAHCKPSPLLKVSDEFLKNHPNRGIRVHYDLLASQQAFVAPRTRVWQQFKDEYDATVQRLWRLEATPPVALGRMQARAQSLIDLSADQQRRRYGTGGGAA